MRYTEMIVVVLAITSAAAAKTIEIIDPSTTVGVLASIGIGMFAGGSVCLAGVALTLLSRKRHRS